MKTSSKLCAFLFAVLLVFVIVTAMNNINLKKENTQLTENYAKVMQISHNDSQTLIKFINMNNEFLYEILTLRGDTAKLRQFTDMNKNMNKKNEQKK